jgi:hypothetical protein
MQHTKWVRTDPLKMGNEHKLALRHRGTWLLVGERIETPTLFLNTKPIHRFLKRVITKPGQANQLALFKGPNRLGVSHLT